MKTYLRLFIVTLFFLVSSFSVFGSHIVGGVINYVYLGGNRYLVTMKIYRDCTSSTDFDGVGRSPAAEIGLYYESTNVLANRYNMGAPTVTRINPIITSSCMDTSVVCLEEGVYTDTITVPNTTSAFYLSYVRCCRNASVDNIVTPGSVGATFTVRIPPSGATPNSNPVYNTFPPIFICQNADLVFNHSATDPDGDSLYYELCNPLLGGSTFSPSPGPRPAPYSTITFAAPYSATDPLGSSPPPAVALTIDHATGLLTGTPPTIGQFTVGICVHEYRGGVELSVTMRDFQFNVVNCPIPISSIPSSAIDPTTGVGTFTTNCDNYTITFSNRSSGSTRYHWDFGVAGRLTDTSNVTNPVYTYPDTGTFLVTLIAYNDAGCTDTSHAYVRVYPGLIQDFNFTNECVDTTVQFFDASYTPFGVINYWHWTFGDGATSSLQSPTHLYGAVGAYSVNLQVKTDKGCDKNITKRIVIDPKPIPNFITDSTCINSAVYFTNLTTLSSGSLVYYDWNFGDGSAHTSTRNTSHTYTASGTYNVTMTVRSDSGCQQQITKAVTVYPRPTISTSPDTSICPGTSTQIAASGGVNYYWSPATRLSSTSIASPIANPLVNTTYRVTVSDVHRCQSIDSVMVRLYVNNTNFLFTNECKDTAVQFTDLSTTTGGIINQWKWTFGDAATGTIQNPAHLYGSAGLYTVKLVITTDIGCKDSISKTLRIYPIPHPGFTYDSSCINNAVFFKDSTRYYLVGDTINSRIWNWGDGTPNTIGPGTTNHTYTSAGTYTVTLTVRTDSGCTQFVSRNVVVHPRPIIATSNDTFICPGSSTQIAASGGINYVWSPSTALSSTRIANPISNTLSNISYYVTVADTNKCQSFDSVKVSMYVNSTNFSFTNECKDTAVQFTDLSTTTGGIINQWKWTFGDLATGTIQNPSHLYGSAGLYTVKLVITTDKGCKDSTSKTLRIYPIPHPGFTYDSSCINNAVFFKDSTRYYLVGDTINSRIWNWGDGTPNTIGPGTTNHTYTSAGTYTVTLTVRTDSGCTQFVSRNVVVHPRPIITTSNDTFICPGSSTQIAARGGVNYVWSPSTALSSTRIANPISNTLSNITYYVTVADTNKCQSFDSVKVSMYVNSTNFSFTNECKDTAVQFTDLSTTTGGIINQWKWTFGDLTTGTIQNPSHLYGSAGLYTVKLVITTDKGCKDSTAKTLRIYPIPNPGFIYDSTCVNNAVYFRDSTHYFYSGDSIQSRYWSWGDGSPILLTVGTANHTFSIAGNYSVTLTVRSDSGCTQKNTQLITVHPLPVIVLTPDTIICPGTSIQLNATGGISYYWKTSLTLSDTSISNPIASPITRTTYYVKVKDINRCQNNDSVNVNLYALSPVSAGLDTSVCLNPSSFRDSVQLNASGGISYQWSPVYNISNRNISNPWVSPDTNTNYIARIADIHGCFQYDTVRVTVLDPALDLLTAKDTFLCQNDTIQVRVIDQGVSGYTWSPALNISNTTIRSPYFYPHDTTSYFLRVVNYCYTKNDTMKFNVYPLPVVNFTFDTTCVRSPVNFTDLSSGVIRSWRWTFGDDSTSILQNPIHTFSSSGVFQVRLIDTTNLGCFDSLYHSLTVHPRPIISITPDTNLCPNEFTSLWATGGIRYFWSPSSDLNNDSIYNPTTTIQSDRTYKLTVADINTCQSFDSVHVHYYYLKPNFYATDECLDTAVQFIDSSRTDAGVIDRWRWTFGDGGSASTANPSHLYLLPNTYNVMLYISTSEGCDSSIIKPITIFPLPQLNIRRYDSICAGDKYYINADSSLVYAWDPNPTLFPWNTHNPIANPITTTNYYVTLKDSNFCVNRDSIRIKVNLLPNINISTPPSILCKGNIYQLNATTAPGFYVWNKGYTLDDSTILSPSLTLDDTAIYWMKVTDYHGCSNFDTVTLNVQQPVNATVLVDTVICRGSQVNLLASGGKYYLWTPSTYLTNGIIPNPIVRPDSSILYLVRASNDCFSDDTTVTILVNQLPLANAGADNTIYRNQTATLHGSGGISYAWTPDNYLNNPFANTTVASPLETTKYILQVTDINGCVAFDTVIVYVIGQTVLQLPTAFSPDGNGVNDIFRISKWLNIEHLDVFEIYNRWGEKIFSTTDINGGWDGTFNGREQPQSVYVWTIKAIDYDGNEILKSGNVTLLR